MTKKPRDKKDPNFVIKGLTKISDEAGIRIEMVNHIYKSIIKKRENINKVDSKNATRLIIQDLINNKNGDIKEILEFNGIKSSKDLGNIVNKLCKEGLIIKEEDDSYEDFTGCFETETIDNFIKNEKLKKDRDWFKIICYVLYTVGFTIVIASYVTYIPKEVGWSGWGIGMLGWILLAKRKKVSSFFRKKN